MKASLDTNVMIHFYRAGKQDILFAFFDKGVFIYEQIRTVELENHGQDVLTQIDADIADGKLELYTCLLYPSFAGIKHFRGCDAAGFAGRDCPVSDPQKPQGAGAVPHRDGVSVAFCPGLFCDADAAGV